MKEHSPRSAIMHTMVSIRASNHPEPVKKKKRGILLVVKLYSLVSRYEGRKISPPYLHTHVLHGKMDFLELRTSTRGKAASTGQVGQMERASASSRLLPDALA